MPRYIIWNHVGNRRYIAVFAIICLMVSCLGGCSKYKQIKITGGRIDNITMVSLRTINLTLVVGIDNPAGKLDVREADGELFHFGKVIGKVTLDPFIVNPKTSHDHRLSARIDISPEVGLRELMSFMDVGKLYDCMVDVYVKGRVAGIAVKTNIKEIPLEKLLER